MHHFGLFHLHRRKQRLEPYPHPDPWKRALDRVIYAIAILAPVMSLPQVWDIWSTRSAGAVSLLTWGSWIGFAAIWLLYGFVHREKPIIVMNILWILVDVAVVAGILMFG